MQHHLILSHFLVTCLIMVPVRRVSPEETHAKNNIDPLDIPVAEQARIYASLDSQNPHQTDETSSEPRSSRFSLRRQLSHWFPHGLLWTPDDDEEVKDKSVSESDDGELEDSLLDRSFVVQVESAAPATITSPQTSFLNILQSFQEGDRLLEHDFDEGSSSDEYDASGARVDNRLGLGDSTQSRSHSFSNPSRNLHHRSRRQADTPDDTTTDSTSTSSTSSTPLTSTPPSLEVTMCTGVPPGVPHRPGEDLSCYTCTSSTSDSDPQCDYRLWKYLRHSEKFNLRGRCGRGSHACMRRVAKRHGLRLTERGCVPTPLLVHADKGITHATFSHSPNPNSTKFKVKELNPNGCYTHSQKSGFLTTACFCTTNLCNGATTAYPQLPRIARNESSILSMVGICLALFLYGLALALFQ